MPYSYDEMLVLAEQRVQRLWPLYRKHYCGDREDLVQTAALALWEWARNTNADLNRLPEPAAEKLVRSAIATEVKNNRKSPPSIFVELDGEMVNMVDVLPSEAAKPLPVLYGHEAISAAARTARIHRNKLSPEERRFLNTFTYYKYDYARTAAKLQMTLEDTQAQAVSVFKQLRAFDLKRQERLRERRQRQ